MGKKLKLTTKNAEEVLGRLFTQMGGVAHPRADAEIRGALKDTLLDLAKDRKAGAVVREKLNGMLDQLQGDDTFGTEGQLDPRGDHRNNA